MNQLRQTAESMTAVISSAQAVTDCLKLLVLLLNNMRLQINCIINAVNGYGPFMRSLGETIEVFLVDAITASENIISKSFATEQVILRASTAYELATEKNSQPRAFRTACIEAIHATESARALNDRTEAYALTLLGHVIKAVNAVILNARTFVGIAENAELSDVATELRRMIQAADQAKITAHRDFGRLLDITNEIHEVTFQFSQSAFEKALKSGVLTHREHFLAHQEAHRTFDVPNAEEVERMGNSHTFAEFLAASVEAMGCK